jgi:hypothetical protein
MAETDYANARTALQHAAEAAAKMSDPDVKAFRFTEIARAWTVLGEHAKPERTTPGFTPAPDGEGF